MIILRTLLTLYKKPRISFRTGFVGTVGFMAPEVLNCTFAEPSSDFFSLGVVTYMLLSGTAVPPHTVKGKINLTLVVSIEAD